MILASSPHRSLKIKNRCAFVRPLKKPGYLGLNFRSKRFQWCGQRSSGFFRKVLPRSLPSRRPLLNPSAFNTFRSARYWRESARPDQFWMIEKACGGIRGVSPQAFYYLERLALRQYVWSIWRARDNPESTPRLAAAVIRGPVPVRNGLPTGLKNRTDQRGRT